MVEKKIDRLSALIKRFRIEARVYTPALQSGGLDEFTPNFYVIGKDAVGFSNIADDRLQGLENALVFFPRGLPDDVKLTTQADEDGYVSAIVDTGGDINPISLALPDLVVIKLDETPTLQTVAEILFDEVVSPRCGGQSVIDRLCEIVVIRLLRHLIETGKAQIGLVGGLAHPNLSLAIVAIHEAPEKNWRLEELAELAAMSRTSFVNSFRDVMGVTPGEYLSQWRLTLARLALAKGEPLKAIVNKVGFSSSAALSRAFKRRYGVSPKQGMQNYLSLGTQT